MMPLTPKAGNIILIRKGTLVWYEARYGPARQRTQGRDHIAVVEHVTEAGNVVWSVGGLQREAAAENVELLNTGNHWLTVGRRRILGGHPIRGMGNIYATSGHCACGDEYRKRPNAEDVRMMHRAHVLAVAERAQAMA